MPLVLQYNFELHFYYLTKMTPSTVYLVGTLVEVDHTQTGYIIELDDTDNDNVLFKVNYTVGNDIEEHVHQSRCRPVSLRRASTTRSGAIRQAIPLSVNPPPPVTDPLPISPPPILPRTREYEQLKEAIKASKSWISSKSTRHPLYHGEENEVVGDMAPDLVEEEAIEDGGDFEEAVV